MFLGLNPYHGDKAAALVVDGESTRVAPAMDLVGHGQNGADVSIDSQARRYLQVYEKATTAA